MGPNRYLIQSIDVIKVLKCKYWAGQWIIVPPNPLVHLKDRVFFLLAQIEIYTMEDDIFTYGMRLQSLFYFISNFETKGRHASVRAHYALD